MRVANSVLSLGLALAASHGATAEDTSSGGLGAIIAHMVGVDANTSQGSASAASSAAKSVIATSVTETVIPISPSATAAPTATPTGVIDLSPCGIISSSSKIYAAQLPEPTAPFNCSASLALECLQSIPIDDKQSKAFVEYITPFLQFQSTIAYLKNPPPEWTLSGVDLLGGLETISQNIRDGTYKSQWAFEAELYQLVNTMPKDFHLNLPTPLISSISPFLFITGLPALVSISMDGGPPQPYAVHDLEKLHNSSAALDWTPSPIKTINGKDAGEFILRYALETGQYQDADASYNTVLPTIPLVKEIKVALVSNGENYGSNYGFASAFDNDDIAIVYANGTTQNGTNIAFVVMSFEDINDGDALFSKIEIPVYASSTSAPAASSAAASSTFTQQESTTSPTFVATGTAIPSPSIPVAPGFPTPIIPQFDENIGGYFLNDPNANVAVLDLYTFEGDNEQRRTQYLADFLAECKKNEKSKLIIDLRQNGGGNVDYGFDAFGQLFPNVQTLAATRMRSTPMGQYLSDVYSTITAKYNETVTVGVFPYWSYNSVDANLRAFNTYEDFIGPQQIYGDNFTALLRPTPDQSNNSTDSPQFSPENIIMFHDGLCGSTCTIFVEFMKSEVGVRSIAVGGRNIAGPMQGVAGSKGAEVLEYSDYKRYMNNLQKVAAVFSSHGDTMPSLDDVPSELIISTGNAPLGNNAYLVSADDSSRINLRNNYNSTDPSEIPLEFVYEATNCRLYYEFDDLWDVTALWSRVANVTWGTGKCTEGSTVTNDNTLPTGPGSAYATVPFSVDRVVNITVNHDLPGFVPNPHRPNQ